MALIDIDLTKYDTEFMEAAMNRVEKAACAIRDAAKANCVSGTITRPVYKTGKYAGKYWTERTPGAMKSTIRIAKKEGKKNILVIAGNKKTFWAVQMEYGRGGWKGGAKPFMRPAIASTQDTVQSIIEGG